MLLSQVPDILLEAATRPPRRTRRMRVRVPLLVPKGCTLPPPSLPYNNYLAPKTRSKAPQRRAAPGEAKRSGAVPGEAQRRRGAPFGNRNAAKKPRNPAFLALQARIADLLARADDAMARARLVIAALEQQAAEAKDLLHVVGTMRPAAAHLGDLVGVDGAMKIGDGLEDRPRRAIRGHPGFDQRRIQFMGGAGLQVLRHRAEDQGAGMVADIDVAGAALHRTRHDRDNQSCGMGRAPPAVQIFRQQGFVRKAYIGRRLRDDRRQRQGAAATHRSARRRALAYRNQQCGSHDYTLHEFSPDDPQTVSTLHQPRHSGMSQILPRDDLVFTRRRLAVR